ncbi:MAG: hypothetical protein A2589_01645 [Candidatus Vogelbacteria bacterium RIFOXYD1_FULL_46_19]|uniref:histidine kinase n=1 Tax=Candidatus Vogelbacteria bacterium RIFOXYD1_FULL_46_19 TaxID=1802439 RepID=A0A1G2QGC6_9BACT|nr:MAG: hypothetical protein A2589_01645 [Candidatus Vogelbacteria bacterium RIFOXYD1_FULL_46_19]
MVISHLKTSLVKILSLAVILVGSVLLAVLLGWPLSSEALSQTVTMQMSVLLLLAFAMANFLFVTKLLHVSNLRNRVILENMGEGLVVVDTAGRIQVINGAAKKMLNINEKLKAGQLWEKLVSLSNPDSGVETKEIVTATIKNRKKTFSEAWIMKGQTGSPFAAAVSVSPIVSAERILGAIIVFRNIEKEKQIDRAKNEFISLVSHQLRTPLSAINWYAEALMTGDLGKLKSEQAEYLHRISDSNQRMIALVNSILEVSRIELDTFIVDARLTDVAGLLDEAVADFSYQLKLKSISLIKKYSSSIGVVNMDPRYGRMIMENLLSNAIKYTPSGGEVTVAALIKKNQLHLEVSDTGYGIPKEEVSKVFTKMFRGHNIIDKDTDGTGLGLYIVKSIVDSAGGRISFETEEDKGTKFTVILPVKKGTKSATGNRHLASAKL